jgi:(heptosyl)LPS beta-1,4-glucosyltransferase
LGRWVQNGLWWPDYQLRLWKRGIIQWPKEVHGIPKPTEPTAQVAATPDLALIHYAYNTMSEFVEMVNTYTKFEVEHLREQGYRFRRRHLVVSPLREFWRRYVANHGYRDGFDGLVLAWLLTAYKGVTVLKYWERYGQRDYRDKGQGLVRGLVRIMLDR